MHELIPSHPLPQDENLKKHVAAIHISNRLSLLERKISNVLLWNAYEDLLTQDKHCMRVQDLAEMIGFHSHDREVLKTALKGLMSTILEWNVLDEKGREKDWEACTMLDYSRMSGSYCYYSYPKELRQKLYNPAMYERINISIQRKFSSGYALVLYENCVRFRKLGHTGWIPLATFRKLMGVGPKEYQDFRRLNSRVIKEPVNQVNTTSDIRLTVEYQRDKRRVSAVRFLVKDNPQLSLFKGAKKGEEQKALPAAADDDPLVARLVDFGLNRDQALLEVERHPATYIEENLEIVEGYLKAGKIKTSLAATTLDALKKDYRPQPAPKEARLKATRAARAKARVLPAAEAEDTEFEAARQELKATLARLSPDERGQLEADFEAAILGGDLPGGPLIREQWLNAGFESYAIQGMFMNFARERLTARAA